MTISEIFILSQDLHVILEKIYRPDVAIKSIEEFALKAAHNYGAELEPVFKLKGVTFFHIRRHKLYFIATTSHDVCLVAGIELLSRIYEICKDCCGMVNEDTVKLNYVLIQEILDEVVDYGYVQLLSTEKIKHLLYSDPVLLKTSQSKVPGLFGVEHKPTESLSKPVIKTKFETEDRKNEIYVDVIERMSIVVDKDGVVNRCSVNGHMNMKTFIMSGSQVRLQFNESLVLKQPDTVKGYGSNVYIEDYKFHPCVKCDDLVRNNVITMTPPAGEFCVMSYTVNGDLVNGLPFRLKSYCKTDLSQRDIHLGVKLTSDMKRSCHAINVTLNIPVPKSTISVSQQLGNLEQSAEFLQDKKVLVWKIKKIPGKSEVTAHFNIIEGNKSGDASQKEIGPVVLDFEASGYLLSNVHITQLKILDSDKSFITNKWVRYISTAASYVLKLH